MAQGFSKGKSVVGAGVKCFVNGTPVAATSGTEIDFTVPSGVKEIKVNLSSLSTSGTSEPIIQLGDSGGIQASGYLGAGSNINASGLTTTNKTAGFALSDVWVAGRSLHGIGTLVLQDAATNTWVYEGSYGRSDSTGCTIGGGSAALSGELTTVRITTEGGTDTFDAGVINIQYDNPEPVILKDSGRGIVVQTVNTPDGEVATGTTTTPNDDTIPQNTEGNEFLTCTITPQDANNLLRIDVVAQVSPSATGYIAGALFQDSGASAIAMDSQYLAGGTDGAVVFTHWMTAGTASSTTFKVRCGSNAAGTLTFNGRSSSRTGGGVRTSSITITEYKV